jgi:hypothetical protein
MPARSCQSSVRSVHSSKRAARARAAIRSGDRCDPRAHRSGDILRSNRGNIVADVGELLRCDLRADLSAAYGGKGMAGRLVLAGRGAILWAF